MHSPLLGQNRPLGSEGNSGHSGVSADGHIARSIYGDYSDSGSHPATSRSNVAAAANATAAPAAARAVSCAVAVAAASTRTAIRGVSNAAPL
jgi:hypothetical protein